MNTIFLVQARLGSSRFPGKLLAKLKNDHTLIDIQLYRLLLSSFITRENLFILTTDQSKDDHLFNYLTERQFKVYRGSEKDVYQRYSSFLQEMGITSDYICRICADNPFIEPEFINQLLMTADQAEKPIDYLSFMNSKLTILFLRSLRNSGTEIGSPHKNFSNIGVSCS